MDPSKLHYYAESGKLERLQKIIEQRPKIDLNIKDQYGSSIFYKACGENRLEVVKYLLKFPQLDPNTTNRVGDTPLIAACVQNHLLLAKILLADPRVNLNQRNDRGNTALFVSVWFRRLEMVKMLLADGRDVGFDSRGSYWGTEKNFAYSPPWKGRNNSRSRYCGAEEISALDLAHHDLREEDDPTILNLLKEFQKTRIAV
ncbi:MAG: ankyrin repeat domain-containing protein [Nitrososphaerales archaeon]